MSDYQTLQIERFADVAVIHLNRPDSLNAINRVLRTELLTAVRRVNDDPEIRVAVLTGKGRAFSAGADLTEDAGGAQLDVRVELKEEYKPVLMAIYDAPKPWISAINGAAAGIGSAFAMACDLSVMADNAYIYQAFAAISLVPDGGATWHLAHILGRKRAYELIATGEKVPAQKCLELGLVNRVVPADELLPATVSWAAELAVKAPLALQHAKSAVNFAMESSLADTIDREADLQYLCVNSEDAKEGIRAFREKRPARFKGC